VVRETRWVGVTEVLAVAVSAPCGDSQDRIEGAPADQTRYKRHESEYLENGREQIVAYDKPSKIDHDKTCDDADDPIFVRLIQVPHR
jgi:hypothetical protein